ncbi:MAG: hypothetical protein RSD71_14915 [Flavobacterium sp.]
MSYIKKSKYSLLLLVFLAFTVACQKRNENALIQQTEKKDTVENNRNQLPSYHTPKNVEDIKEFHTVWEQKTQSGSFKKISFDYNCENEKSGKLTYFFEDGKLRIIEYAYSEYDHFSATDRYYIADGIPFFVYSKEVVWSFVAEGITKDNVTEYRGYIINDQPVECLEKKYTLHSKSDTNPNPDEIPNKNSDCKNIQKLIKKYQKLATYKSTKDVECI